MKKHIPDFISVGKLAERTGIAVSALHFYEKKGLIQSTRNGSNHRQYPRYTIRLVSIIQVAQKTGFTLEEILTELNKLPDRANMTFKDWQNLGNSWQGKLDQKIQKLTRLRDQMTDCIGCGCLSFDRCSLLNPNDKLAEQGPGARLLV